MHVVMSVPICRKATPPVRCMGLQQLTPPSCTAFQSSFDAYIESLLLKGVTGFMPQSGIRLGNGPGFR